MLVGCTHLKKENIPETSNSTLPQWNEEFLLKLSSKVRKNPKLGKWIAGFQLAQNEYHQSLSRLGERISQCHKSSAPPPEVKSKIDELFKNKQSCDEVRVSIGGIWIENLSRCQEPAVKDILYAELQLYPFLTSSKKHFSSIQMESKEDSETLDKMLQQIDKYIEQNPSPLFTLLESSTKKWIWAAELKKNPEIKKVLKQLPYFNETINLKKTQDLIKNYCPNKQ